MPPMRVPGGSAGSTAAATASLGTSTAQIARSMPASSPGVVMSSWAKELRPGAVGCIGQIMGRAFAFPVPPSRGLFRSLPEEWERWRGVPIQDHVAGEPVSECAKLRTR